MRSTSWMETLDGTPADNKTDSAPTPGTCTFAGWESLQDGIRWGVPGVGVKDSNTGKYLENQQTEPDIKVFNKFELVSKGRDQQLEAAIAALMKLVSAGGVVP